MTYATLERVRHQAETSRIVPSRRNASPVPRDSIHSSPDPFSEFPAAAHLEWGYSFLQKVGGTLQLRREIPSQENRCAYSHFQTSAGRSSGLLKTVDWVVFLVPVFSAFHSLYCEFHTSNDLADLYRIMEVLCNTCSDSHDRIYMGVQTVAFQEILVLHSDSEKRLLNVVVSILMDPNIVYPSSFLLFVKINSS